MGLLGDIFRAAGRAAGRGVEWVGEKLNSEKIQQIGRDIQDACRETSRKTGKTNEYDQETASERETERMADSCSVSSRPRESITFFNCWL